MVNHWKSNSFKIKKASEIPETRSWCFRWDNCFNRFTFFFSEKLPGSPQYQTYLKTEKPNILIFLPKIQKYKRHTPSSSVHRFLIFLIIYTYFSLATFRPKARVATKRNTNWAHSCFANFHEKLRLKTGKIKKFTLCVANIIEEQRLDLPFLICEDKRPVPWPVLITQSLDHNGLQEGREIMT